MNILMIDNYDSFTYNLVHLLESFPEVDVSVRRNDQISLSEVDEYQKIILSPGPGLPSEAGIMPELVRQYSSSKSILGICLGHQCIGESFGAQLRNLKVPVHGKATSAQVVDPDEQLFRGISENLTVGRYHSWVVEKEGLPSILMVTARSDDGEIMGLRHREYDVRGVQFHPESILTQMGREMLANWIGR
jgi:anthranilate synthase component 2